MAVAITSVELVSSGKKPDDVRPEYDLAKAVNDAQREVLSRRERDDESAK